MGVTCDQGTMCCVKIDSNIQLNCGYGGQGCPCQGLTTYSQVLYGMNGDDSTHKLRWAHPHEVVEIWTPNPNMLGWGFTRRPK
jgi:hypothetical protein